MNHWIHELNRNHDKRESLPRSALCVIVTVIRTRGSTPREIGTSMVTTLDGCWGTIGGGELEYQCQSIATNLLNTEQANTRTMRNFPLGSNCGQCCGGVVDVLFEVTGAQSSSWPIWIEQARDALLQADECILARCLPSDRLTAENATLIYTSSSQTSSIQKALAKFQSSAQTCAVLNIEQDGLQQKWFVERVVNRNVHIAVFGAGHVGRAVVNTLATIDAQLICIDSRQDFCAQDTRANVDVAYATDPARLAAQLPAHSFCVVMTHSHAQDFEICHALLRRQDIEFCGLIGSSSKKAKYLRLTKKIGLTKCQTDGLTCPIGVSGINSKTPADIAISVAAQVLQAIERMHMRTSHTEPNHIQEQESQRAALYY